MIMTFEEEKIRELIIRFRTSLSLPYREKLADRLMTLFDDAKEEDSASTGISIGSLQSFYNFLELCTDSLKCPTISLTPENDIYATWKEKNHISSMHFLPDGDIRFMKL